MTGYDIKRRFHDPIGFFYRASDGSLYPALKKLAHDGLVTMRAERHGRRARKVYAITAKGREHFLRRLREPAQPIFVYDEAQVKIYFAHHDPEAALQHVERERRFAGAWQSFLERLLEEMKSNGASPFRTSMVEIGHGIAALKADLFDKLMVRLARDLRGASRTRNGARSGRRTGNPRRRSRIQFGQDQIRHNLMKAIIRRVMKLAIVALILGGGYYLGNRYLWPAPDTGRSRPWA